MPLTFAPAVVAATLLLLAPGLLWAWWRYPSPEGATRLAVGLALGFAFQIHVSALLAWGAGITRSSVLLATICGLAVACLLIWRTPSPLRAQRSSTSRRYGLQLAVLLAGIALPRLLPLVLQQIPAGWDPSFHSLLASTTLTSHRLPTWSPFEQIPSNYPYGPHVFIAEISLLTAIAPDTVFTVLLNAVLPALTCLALYSLARRVLRSHAYALGAVAAYGLLGNWGSIEYLQWGGLPNELGFFVLLAFLVVLFAPGREQTRVLTAGILLGAIPLTHHHVMLTTALLLAVYAAYVAVLWLRTPRGAPLRQQAAHILTRLALVCVVALVTASYYVLPLALRAGSLGSTNVAQYTDEYFGLPFEKNGWLLWALAVAGTVLAIRAAQAHRRSYPKLRVRYVAGGLSGLARAFGVSASITLAVAFVLFFFGYRTYSLYFSPAHQPYTLFTPSRFLTDLTYFLAFPAAILLVNLWRWRPGPAALARLGRAATLLGTRTAFRTVIAVCVLSTTLITLDIPAIQADGRLAPGESQAFAWIRAHTPANTLVVNLDPTAKWAPYFTQREVAYTPVPISEFTAGYVNEKRALADALMRIIGSSPALRVVAFAGLGSAFESLSTRPVAALTTTALPAAAPAYTSGPERVYLLGDAFAHAGIAPSSTASARVLWWQPGTTPPTSWITLSAPDPTVWNASPPQAVQRRSVAYLRLPLVGPLPVGVSLSCRFQTSGAVYVDGAALSNPCTGALVPIPQLTAPGPHVIALRADVIAGMDPWLNLLVVAPQNPIGPSSQ